MDYVNFVSWNKEDANSKLNCTDTVKYLNIVDVISLVETWCIYSECVISILPEYTCYYIEDIKIGSMVEHWAVEQYL
jgi:hypothetical protein